MYRFRSTTGAAALLILTLGFGPLPGMAADISVAANATSSGQKSFGGSDQVIVGAGGLLTSSSSPTLNQTTTSTNVVIDNAGTIESTGTGARAIRFNSGTTMSFTLTNEAGATIQSQNDVINVGTNVSSGSIVINNYGTMQATGVNANNGQSVDFGAIIAGTASVTINNFSTGLMQSADADGLRPGNNATVNNYGQIIGNNYQLNTGADGVDFQTSTGGTVNNHSGGVISGGRHGVNISYDATKNATTSFITVTNEAGGQIIGRNGSGVGSDVGGVVTNYGLISGRIDTIVGAANGDGDGVDIDYTATIVNYGIIEGTGAKGVGTDGFTNSSQGVAIGGGTVDNMSGAIIRGQADGILVDNSSQGPAYGPATIRNAGLIEGTTRYGISINGSFNNTIINSGVISGAVAAVLTGSGDDTLDIRNGGKIIGSVNLGGGKDRLLIERGSYVLAFGSTVGLSVSAPGAVAVSADHVAVLDRSSLPRSTALETLSVVGDILSTRADDSQWGDASAAPVKTKGPSKGPQPLTIDTPWSSWARFFGVAYNGRSQSDYPSYNMGIGGGAFGADMRNGADLLIGGMFAMGGGKFNSSAEVTQSINFLGGVYGRWSPGPGFMDVSLSVGHSADDGTRSQFNNMVASGVETARSRQKGLFISPQVGVGMNAAWEGLVLTPAVRLRYLSQFFDSYSETGALNGLTVGSRVAQAFEARSELGIARHFESGLTLRAKIGALYDASLSGSQVSASIAGAPIQLPAAERSYGFGGFANLGASVNVGSQASIFAEVEGLSKKQVSAATGRAGLRFQF